MHDSFSRKVAADASIIQSGSLDVSNLNEIVQRLSEDVAAVKSALSAGLASSHTEAERALSIAEQLSGNMSTCTQGVAMLREQLDDLSRRVESGWNGADFRGLRTSIEKLFEDITLERAERQKAAQRIERLESNVQGLPSEILDVPDKLRQTERDSKAAEDAPVLPKPPVLPVPVAETRKDTNQQLALDARITRQTTPDDFSWRPEVGSPVSRQVASNLRGSGGVRLRSRLGSGSGRT